MFTSSILCWFNCGFASDVNDIDKQSLSHISEQRKKKDEDEDDDDDEEKRFVAMDDEDERYSLPDV